jgi:hypothetical protein
MKNWKTTLCGAAIAALMALSNYNGANTWQGYAQALGVAALGALAKDFDQHSTVAETQQASLNAPSGK